MIVNGGLNPGVDCPCRTMNNLTLPLIQPRARVTLTREMMEESVKSMILDSRSGDDCDVSPSILGPPFNKDKGFRVLVTAFLRVCRLKSEELGLKTNEVGVGFVCVYLLP